jgi:hypothetical protein
MNKLSSPMMLPADLTLWILTILVEAFVVCLFVIRGLFRRFLFLNLYLLLSVVISIGRYAVLSHCGYASSNYASFYYFGDALIAVSLFLSIGELSMRLVLTKMSCRKIVLLMASVVLAAAVRSPLSVPWYLAFRVTTRFAFELSQNILFASAFASVLLWTWKLRNEPEDGIAARFVSVLSLYFSLLLLAHGARQLAPQAPGVDSLFPMIGAWLPLGCGIALVSQEQPRRAKQ